MFTRAQCFWWQNNICHLQTFRLLNLLTTSFPCLESASLTSQARVNQGKGETALLVARPPEGGQRCRPPSGYCSNSCVKVWPPWRWPLREGGRPASTATKEPGKSLLGVQPEAFQRLNRISIGRHRRSLPFLLILQKQEIIRKYNCQAFKKK